MLNLSDLEVLPEDVESSFRYIQWHNGNLDSNESNELLKNGSWLLSPEIWPNLNGNFQTANVTFADGNTEEKRLIGTLNLSVIQYKTGYKDNDTNELYLKKDNIPLSANTKYKMYLYTYVKELEDIAIITTGGIVAFRLLEILVGNWQEKTPSPFKEKIRKPASKLFNAPTLLPNYAFWLTLSSSGEKVKYAKYNTFATPPKLDIPEEPTNEDLENLFVGKELYQKIISEYREEAKIWYDNNQSSSANDSNDDIPPEDEDEDEEAFKIT